jgi:hypothetical protein
MVALSGILGSSAPRVSAPQQREESMRHISIVNCMYTAMQ